jgi:hypothetical protein
MQGEHPQPRVQQPLDQHPVRTLHRHQPHLQPHQLPAQRSQPLLIMRERRGQQLLARRIRDQHVVLLRRPVNTGITSHPSTTSLGQGTTRQRPDREVPLRVLIDRPSQRGSVLSPLVGTSPPPGRGWSSSGPPKGGRQKLALFRAAVEAPTRTYKQKRVTVAGRRSSLGHRRPSHASIRTPPLGRSRQCRQFAGPSIPSNHDHFVHR